MAARKPRKALHIAASAAQARAAPSSAYSGSATKQPASRLTAIFRGIGTLLAISLTRREPSCYTREGAG